MFSLDLMFELLDKKTVELRPGAYVEIGDDVNLNISGNGELINITPSNPNVYLKLTKLGPLPLIIHLRPKIDKIEIRKKSIKVVLHGQYPDIEFER